ncbi:hypothetical protein QBC36DRAFT_343591 [Triangularia setosa]|uniref:Uncharacterized protein n=1 Tax=Triangularia setosa TaxID=2587417 RepID=A0AAN6WDR6_9PEZI|nr:hypothetical protein QBC36DRAFT_343591 [Podospora setosa]
MHFRQALTALTGLVSSVVGAPAPIDHDTTSRGGLKNTTNDEKSSLLDSLLPPLGSNNIILPGAGLNILTSGAISQLARIAELELAALVESQFALAIQLETIKTNIRVNHFRAQFPQVVCPLQNCVIICVTNVLDQRDPENVNNRYLLNQLRIDNGFPDKELLIMVTDSQRMTIMPTPTAVADFSQNPINSAIPDSNSISEINTEADTSTFTDILSHQANSESTLFPPGQPTPSPLNNAGSAAQPTPSPVPPSPDSTQQAAGASSLNLGSLVQPTASPSANFTRNKKTNRRQINLINLPPSASLPNLADFNLLNQSLLLPFGAAAPTFGSSLGLVLADPASVILPNQQNVFVDTLDSLQLNCLALQLGIGTAGGLLLSGHAGLGLGGFQGQLFGSLEAALAAQLAGLGLLNGGLDLGGLQPVIPPGILAANPDLAEGGGLELVATVPDEFATGTWTDTTTTENLATKTLADIATLTDTFTDTTVTETESATVADEFLSATDTATATRTTDGEVTETAVVQARATRRRRY